MVYYSWISNCSDKDINNNNTNKSMITQWRENNINAHKWANRMIFFPYKGEN